MKVIQWIQSKVSLCVWYRMINHNFIQFLSTYFPMYLNLFRFAVLNHRYRATNLFLPRWASANLEFEALNKALIFSSLSLITRPYFGHVNCGYDGAMMLHAATIWSCSVRVYERLSRQCRQTNSSHSSTVRLPKTMIDSLGA